MNTGYNEISQIYSLFRYIHFTIEVFYFGLKSSQYNKAAWRSTCALPTLPLTEWCFKRHAMRHSTFSMMILSCNRPTGNCSSATCVSSSPATPTGEWFHKYSSIDNSIRDLSLEMNFNWKTMPVERRALLFVLFKDSAWFVQLFIEKLCHISIFLLYLPHSLLFLKSSVYETIFRFSDIFHNNPVDFTFGNGKSYWLESSRSGGFAVFQV